MDMTHSIPEQHQEFCKAVARLCREYGLRHFEGAFNPAYGDQWKARIQFSWDQGRHGADAGGVTITSTLDVFTEIDG